MNRRWTIVAALLLVIGAAGCGGDDADADAEPVVFGEGEIPSAVPGDFPIPDGASIGSTLVDRINNRSEFTVNVGEDLTSIVAFFTVELVNEGFVVDRSTGNELGWEVEFSRGSLLGEILLTPVGSATAAVVSINRS
jgi:hypothetical protein